MPAFYNNKDIQRLTNFGYRKCLELISEVNQEALRRGYKVISNRRCSALLFDEIYGIKKATPKTDKELPRER